MGVIFDETSPLKGKYRENLLPDIFTYLDLLFQYKPFLNLLHKTIFAGNVRFFTLKVELYDKIELLKCFKVRTFTWFNCHLMASIFTVST